MKVATRAKYGSPANIAITTLPDPKPIDGEILVKVFSSTVNRTDCANLTGSPFIMRLILGFPRPRKTSIGTDFSGVVVGLGKGASKFTVGDKVLGFNDMGMATQATMLTCSEKNAYLLPKNIDFKHAAASLEGAHYAYSFIKRSDIKPGQRILINGASGAIGSALLQFVRLHDVHMTVTCAGKNEALMRQLGADTVYNYTTTDFTQQNNIYDFIFDTVGKSTFGKCSPILSQRGVYISSEMGPYVQNVFLSMVAPLMKKKVVFPVPFSTEESIPFILDHIAKGNFSPVIDREYAFEDIASAYDYVLSGQKTGNVLVNIH